MKSWTPVYKVDEIYTREWKKIYSKEKFLLVQQHVSINHIHLHILNYNSRSKQGQANDKNILHFDAMLKELNTMKAKGVYELVNLLLAIVASTGLQLW